MDATKYYFIEAIIENRVDRINYLLQSNIVIDSEMVALAIKYDRKYMIELLIKHGFNINSDLFLWEALNQGKSDIAGLLVRCGADLIMNYYNGSSPLITAVIYNNDIEIVKLLLDSGDNIDHQDNEFNTALSYALGNDDLVIAKYLLKRNAKTNLKDKNNRTDLVFSARTKNIKACKLLIKYGANPYDCDNKFNNAYDYLDKLLKYTRIIQKRLIVIPIDILITLRRK